MLIGQQQQVMPVFFTEKPKLKTKHFYRSKQDGKGCEAGMNN